MLFRLRLLLHLPQLRGQISYLGGQEVDAIEGLLVLGLEVGVTL